MYVHEHLYDETRRKPTNFGRLFNPNVGHRLNQIKLHPFIIRIPGLLV